MVKTLTFDMHRSRFTQVSWLLLPLIWFYILVFGPLHI